MRTFIVMLVAVLVSECSSMSTENDVGNPRAKSLTSTDRARMQIEIANGALVEGDPTGALQHLTLAEREDNKLPELFHSKALAYYGKKNLPEALKAARQAVALKSDYSDANNTLGKLLMESGKSGEATEYLKRAAEDSLYRESFKAWTNLGILKYQLGEYAPSEQYFKRAVAEAPSRSCIAYHYLGHIKMKENQVSEAILDYEQATKKFCAGYADAQVSLGIAYEKNRQFDLARKTFVEIQKRYPKTKLAEQAVDHLRFLP